MGRVETRFEVGHHLEGLIEATLTLKEAQRIAEDWASRETGYPDARSEVRVFDSMARHGYPEKWCLSTDGQWTILRNRP